MTQKRWLISLALAASLAPLAVTSLAVEVTAADAAAAGVPAEAPADEPVVDLPAGMSELRAFSYAMGHNFGTRVHGDLPELDVAAFQEAMRDAFAGKPSQLDEAQTNLAVTRFNTQREERARLAVEKVAAENLAAAEKFLADNGKRKGVKTTKSGLQYEVLQKGSGPAPKITDIVTAHYHGTLPNGTVFDSSRESGQPVDFPLNRVIPGWTEGLQLMNKGAKFKLFVPPALAYGPRAISPEIGPNQVLVFEVELVDFKAPPPASEMPDGTDPSAVQ